MDSGRANGTWRDPTSSKAISWMTKSAALLLSLASGESPFLHPLQWAMATLLGNQIASSRAKISCLFFISFPAEVSSPLSMYGTQWAWAVAKAIVSQYQHHIGAYGDSLVSPPPNPHGVLESKLKAQVVELRFPCLKMVPTSSYLGSPSLPLHT